MLLVGKILLGAVGSVAAMGAVVSSEGFVNVKVHEKKPEGVHLHIIAPVLLMNVGLHFVPRRDLKQAAEQVRPWLPVIDAAVEELKKGKGSSPAINPNSSSLPTTASQRLAACA